MARRTAPAARPDGQHAQVGRLHRVIGRHVQIGRAGGRAARARADSAVCAAWQMPAKDVPSRMAACSRWCSPSLPPAYRMERLGREPPQVRQHGLAARRRARGRPAARQLGREHGIGRRACPRGRHPGRRPARPAAGRRPTAARGTGRCRAGRPRGARSGAGWRCPPRPAPRSRRCRACCWARPAARPRPGPRPRPPAAWLRVGVAGVHVAAHGRPAAPGRPAQAVQVAALRAERQVGHTAHGVQHADRAPRKALGRGQRRGQRLLNDKVHAALHGHGRASVLFQNCKIAPLHEVARHGRRDRGVRAQTAPRLGAVIGVPGVEWIVFCNDAQIFIGALQKNPEIDVVHLRRVVYNKTIWIIVHIFVVSCKFLLHLCAETPSAVCGKSQTKTQQGVMKDESTGY